MEGPYKFHLTVCFAQSEIHARSILATLLIHPHSRSFHSSIHSIHPFTPFIHSLHSSIHPLAHSFIHPITCFIHLCSFILFWIFFNIFFKFQSGLIFSELIFKFCLIHLENYWISQVTQPFNHQFQSIHLSFQSFHSSWATMKSHLIT